MTGTEVIKSTIRKTVTPKRIEKAKEYVKKTGAAVAPFGALTGAAVAGGYIVSKLQKGRVSKQADRMLADTIKRTPPGLRKQFTPEIKAKLKKQYEEHIRRQNEGLFTK